MSKRIINFTESELEEILYTYLDDLEAIIPEDTTNYDEIQTIISTVFNKLEEKLFSNETIQN